MNRMTNLCFWAFAPTCFAVAIVACGLGISANDSVTGEKPISADRRSPGPSDPAEKDEKRSEKPPRDPSHQGKLSPREIAEVISLREQIGLQVIAEEGESDFAEVLEDLQTDRKTPRARQPAGDRNVQRNSIRCQTENLGEAEQTVLALQDAASELDCIADRLEPRHLYERADALRHEADQLRRDARRIQLDRASEWSTKNNPKTLPTKQ